MPDKTIDCADCGTPFVHTDGAQKFFAEKGFTSDPKRCAPCRKLKKNGGRPPKR